MRKLATSKEIRKLAKDVQDRGAEVVYGSTHIKVKYMGQLVVLSRSPSDKRAVLNMRSDLRRIGAI
jgi:hypothetical protein